MSSSEPEQQELVVKAKSGDAAAFESLVRLNYDFVYKVAFKWCHNQADAEDISQEVLIKLANKIGSFKEESAFQTWLYRITINTAKDLALKNRRDQAKEAAFLEREKDKKSQTQTESGMISSLFGLLEQLPVKLKEVSLLVYSEGLSHKEAAKVLNCAETTISWRVFQAKKKLKSLMESGEFTW